MTNKAIYIILIALGFTIYSCTKKVGKPAVVVTPVVPTVQKCDTITFAKHIKPIVIDKCVSCHNTSMSGANFNIYSDLVDKGKNGNLKKYINSGYMPQNLPPLTQARIDLIECWISNGYKQ